MRFDSFESLIAVSVLVTICILGLTLWRSGKSKTSFYISLVLMAYPALFYLRETLARSEFYSIFNSRLAAIFVVSVIQFLLVTIPVFIAVHLARTLFSQSSKKEQSLPDLTNQQTLNDYVTGILDSEEFLVALRSSLPKGETDEMHGLDYVPFMLHSLDERRKRFAKSVGAFPDRDNRARSFVFVHCRLLRVYLGERSLGWRAQGACRSPARS